MARCTRANIRLRARLLLSFRRPRARGPGSNDSAEIAPFRSLGDSEGPSGRRGGCTRHVSRPSLRRVNRSRHRAGRTREFPIASRDFPNRPSICLSRQDLALSLPNVCDGSAENFEPIPRNRTLERIKYFEMMRRLTLCRRMFGSPAFLVPIERASIDRFAVC